MFCLFSSLRGLPVVAFDGKAGTADDVYFDDDTWRVRYLVADVGPILFGHKALLGAPVLGRPDLEARAWPVRLTRGEVENAPRPEADAPVSAQEERGIRTSILDWPSVVLGPAGAVYTPILAEEHMARLRRRNPPDEAGRPSGNPHLRSMNEVIGYAIHATDGRIGSVEDFLVDPGDWRVAYLMIDTGNWLPGKAVVLSVDHVSEINWDTGEVSVDVTTEQVENSPEPPDVPGLKRRDIDALLAHYGGPPV